ncbi:protein kinase family protein [Cellulosimicrobium cellulans]|uniref:protein kinase family protein n=1 Tax=Cellulosimicrobium cellulans TaxID=1710 RepID=UPI0020CD4CD6|nr:protein kinase family protein [Cellulosimicrobium cellulans]
MAPGTLLVARYRLDEQLASDLSDVTAWSAHDQILDRPVRLSVVTGAHVAEALDSARRAALVVDPRLTRVLDVGSEDGVAYVVTERYTGITLSEVVAGGIVDPQQARAIVGEAAAALEVARRRGVHHLALRPDAVRVDGSRVLVTGLGLDAGVAGHEQHDAEQTSRADAVGLVALLYYAMTARWAGPSLDVPWIAADAIHPLPAQRAGEGVLALSDVRPDVPAELDGLCAETFAGTQGTAEEWTATPLGDGPRSPADVVGAVEPWGEVSVVAALPAFVQPAAGVSRQSVRSAFDGAASAPPGTPPPAPPVRRPTTGRIHRVGAVPGSAGPGVAYAAGAATGATAAVPPPTAEAYSVPPPPVGYDAGTVPLPYDPASPPPPPAGPDAAQAWSEPVPSRRGPRRFNATPIVLVLVLALVVGGVVWAVNTAFDGFGPAVQTNEPTAGGSEAPAEGGEGDASAGEEAPPAPEVRPMIASGTALDPEGDAGGNNDGEHPELASLAYDQQPDTTWISRRYNAADFAGLRSGIGFAVTLEEKAPVSSIVIDTATNGGNVEIRATSPDTPTEGTVLASGPLSPGATFTFEQPVEAESIVLWFTELPQNPAGEYRAEINEILVS